jgi:hypothetical protein
MPDLVPGIHVLLAATKTWMAEVKPGHDEQSRQVGRNYSPNIAFAMMFF